jgi:hypothetical protein
MSSFFSGARLSVILPTDSSIFVAAPSTRRIEQLG